MQNALLLLPLLPLAATLGIYNLPPVPSQITVPASVATYAASIASAQATALSIENNQGISTGTPNDSLPDPCGPPQQVSAPAKSLSTCRTNITTNHTSTPQYYGVTCLNESTAPPSITRTLDVNACANAMIEICYTLAGSYGSPATDEWVFTNGTSTGPDRSAGPEGGGNCTVGFWLPSGGAPAPSFLRCVDGIFGPMVGACGGTKQVGYGGSVNLETLPGFSVASSGDEEGGVIAVGVAGGTGVAVEGGYPSYFFVA